MFLFGSDEISCGIEFYVKGTATKKEANFLALADIKAFGHTYVLFAMLPHTFLHPECF